MDTATATTGTAGATGSVPAGTPGGAGAADAAGDVATTGTDATATATDGTADTDSGTTPTEPHPLLDRAADVADRLRPHADAVDRGDARPHDGYRAVRDAGLLALLVPRQAGGAGGSFLDHTRVLETLATGDGAIALGYNMHNVAIGALCEPVAAELPAPARRFRDWVFTEVVEHGRMFASAVSEPGSGAKLRGIRATYRPCDDGFVLDGTKSFVSLAGIADHYVVAARRDGAADDEVSHFVVSRDDPGVSFDGRWDGAALNGTETAAMTMSGVRIPRERLFLGVEGMSLFKLVREPHWMTAGYMGAYLGIAGSALRFAVSSLAADDRRRAAATVQADVGHLAIRLEAARALVYHAARLVDEGRGSAEANTAVHAAKYTIGDLAPRLAQDAARLCGAAGLGRSSPLERLLRESLFCQVMPAKAAECLEYVGKATLGYDVFDARTFTW